VARMAWPQAPGLATRAAHRERERARARRARRIAALIVVASVALVTLLLTAFGSGASQETTTGPAPAGRLLPSGPPQPQVVAMLDSLRIQLPIAQGRVTAIGYHAAGPEAIGLEPVGEQLNAGLFTRMVDKLFGQSSSGLGFYLLDGGVGPQTGGLDVGAPIETDVYAPVDGTIIAISDEVMNGKAYGVRIDIQPSGNPGYVVTVSYLTPDPSLTVGTTVEAARSKIGRVIDLSAVESAELARVTQDKGQHVHVEVHPATSLITP
jgi:murein DD-endopeptidase MepM/ murein hydrolase activator NlpD